MLFNQYRDIFNKISKMLLSQYMESVEMPREPTLAQMTDAPSDCEAYIKSRGYILHATPQEQDFPIAYGSVTVCTCVCTVNILGVGFLIIS